MGNTRVQDQRLTEDLGRIFKWKNYYQITNKCAFITQDTVCSLPMSDKCMLKVKNMGESKLEVSCFGDGKFVSKGVYSLAPGKWLTLAGSDRNNNAWFIVMRYKEQKDAKAGVTNSPPAKPQANP